MDIQTAKAIPIDFLLQRIGCQPTKTTNGCQWYLSPFRLENTPSFKLTRDRFAWFDHGTGEGGNILDLAFRLDSQQSLPHKLEAQQLKQALAYIDQKVGAPSTRQQPLNNRMPVETNRPAYTITEHQPFRLVDPTGNSSQAALYLASRGISPERVVPYLQEVTFLSADGQKHQGFGLPNVAGGYELRRQGDWAKTAVGPKAITIFKATREAAPWHTFYSLIDFCTYLTIDKPPLGAYHYLIINSDSLVAKAITYLETVPAGFMIQYPHTDESGQNAFRRLEQFLTSHRWAASHKAYLYEGFTDWTEARERQLAFTPRRGGLSTPRALKKTPTL
jgi:hypothetical protein